MKLGVAFGTVLVSAAFALAPARAESDSHVDFFLGQKNIESDYWKPIESQPEIGAVLSFGADDWPVHIALDVLLSAGRKSVSDPLLGTEEFSGWSVELDFGVRKIWKAGKARPYIGGGLSSVYAGLQDENDLGKGVWAGTGVRFRLGSRFELGLDVRYSISILEVGNVYGGGVDGSGFQYGVLLGFGF